MIQERLQPLTDDELRSVVGGDDIVEEIKKMIFHEHESKKNVWRTYGPSSVR